MSLLMPTAMRFYKICAILGTIIIIVTVALAWKRIQQFEQRVYVVYEELVINTLEVDSLKDELAHMDKALQAASEQPQADVVLDNISYNHYEIERLRHDRVSLLRYIKEKEEAIAHSSVSKKHIMHEVRVLFVAALGFLVAGALLSVLGYLGWYYRVEMFEERRRNAR